MRRCHRQQAWWMGLLALFLLVGCDGYVPDDGMGMGGGPLPGSVDDVRKCEDTALCTNQCATDDLTCVESCSLSLSRDQLTRLAPLVLCAARHQCKNKICLRDQCPSSLTACAIGAANAPTEPPRDRLCKEDEECGDVGFCEEGRCVGLPPHPPKPRPCQSDRECGPRSRCHDRRCMPPEPDDNERRCKDPPRCSP